MWFTIWRKLVDDRLTQLVLIAVAVLIAFWGTWNAYFSTPDDFDITGAIYHRDSLGAALQGLANGPRFLNYGMVWIKTQLFSLNAAPYLWIGLLHHVIVAFVIYWLAEFWTKSKATAFLAGLFFVVHFSNWDVVTRISPSDYSFWAIFYFLTLALFAAYLARRTRVLYLVSVVLLLIQALGHDFTLTLPLALLVYHLLIGRGDKPLRSLGWADLKLHIPYWAIWALHVALNVYDLLYGRTEGVYAMQPFAPGLHMLTNLNYLVYHIFPNIPGYNLLVERFGPTAGDLLTITPILLSVVFHIAAVYILWKGSNLMRFAVIMIYLPFLPYTPWEGGFAGAPRYLYTSSGGFALLLALLVSRLYAYLRTKNIVSARRIVVGLVSLFVLGNVIIDQLWVQHHLTTSEFRRNFSTQLMQDFEDVTADTVIFIEVPDDRYQYLNYTCLLVLPIRLEHKNCSTSLIGERTQEQLLSEVDTDRPVYILQAHDDGFYTQLYPAN